MAPERRNTHRVSLDTIAALRSLCGTVGHAHLILRLDEQGVDLRRFRAAWSHYPVTFEEMSTIEASWERWQDHFLGPDIRHTEFQLPAHLAPVKPKRKRTRLDLEEELSHG